MRLTFRCRGVTSPYSTYSYLRRPAGISPPRQAAKGGAFLAGSFSTAPLCADGVRLVVAMMMWFVAVVIAVWFVFGDPAKNHIKEGKNAINLRPRQLALSSFWSGRTNP